MLDARGRIISDNFYWRGVSPNDLTALNDLPPAPIEADITVMMSAANACSTSPSPIPPKSWPS